MPPVAIAVQNIETILNISLVKQNREAPQSNWYNERNDGIEELHLDKVYLNAAIIGQLLLNLKGLRRFTLTNATLSHIGELLKLQVFYLNMDTVVFENDGYDTSIVKGLQLEIAPGEVHIKNSL